MNKKTEHLWKYEFGDKYIKRTNTSKHLKSNIYFFNKIIKKKYKIKSIFEFGCNIGLNFEAIKNIDKKISLSGVEINEKAIKILNSKNIADVFHSSIKNFQTNKLYDLTFTKGVLIHIPPSELNSVYNKIYKFSKRYILIAEYYNPTPLDLNYRGFKKVLFKRDFAGEIMKKFKNLRLIDYGFIYHKDPNFPLDDINWFLMEK